MRSFIPYMPHHGVKPFFVWIWIVAFIMLNACSSSRKTSGTQPNTPIEQSVKPAPVSTSADAVLWFARQQLGIPYRYGSSDPKRGGLDCSGFLYYVFTHFGLKVPRTSGDYMNFGKTVSKQQAQKGDVIIFTGSDAEQKTGGHVGIVLNKKDEDISFIHASTSKGVIVSKLNETYYAKRFLKLVRILP